MLNTRARAAALIGFLATGAILRVWGIGFGLPNLSARPGETSITEGGVNVLRGTFDPQAFNGPSLFTYGVGAGYAIYCKTRVAAGAVDSLPACADTWKRAWEPFFLIARTTSAVAGTAAIAVVFAIGLRLGRSERERVTAALVAAAGMAVSFLHVRDSHFGITDVTMTTLLLASLALIVRADARRSAATFGWAGLIAGLAASVQYNAMLLVAPIAVSQAVEFYEAWRASRQADVRAGIFVGAGLVGFLIGTPYAFIERQRFLRDVAVELDRFSKGHVGLDNVTGWLQHFLVSLPQGVGWPMLLAAIAGLIWLARSQPRTALLTAAFPIVDYVVSGQSRVVFIRHMIPVVPFVCLFAGAFAGWLTRAPRYGTALAAVAAALFVVPNAVKSIEHDRRMGRTDTRVLAAEWVAREIPDDATVFEGGSVYARPDLWRRGEHPPYHMWRWDGDHHEFEGANGEDLWPAFMLLPESPLAAYDAVPKKILDHLDRYTLRETIDGGNGRSHRYDQQDAWYLPIDAVSGVVRPGPTIRIYQKR